MSLSVDIESGLRNAHLDLNHARFFSLTNDYTYCILVIIQVFRLKAVSL